MMLGTSRFCVATVNLVVGYSEFTVDFELISWYKPRRVRDAPGTVAAACVSVFLTSCSFGVTLKRLIEIIDLQLTMHCLFYWKPG